jgi:hypothetical protein
VFKEEDLLMGATTLSAFSILLAVAEKERLQLERAANEVKTEPKDEHEIDLICTENQLSTKDLEYIENRDHLEGDTTNGRSALRSLLETNQPPKVAVATLNAAGPKESVLIRSVPAGQILRKGQLSIPFRMNGTEAKSRCSGVNV